MPDWRSAYLLWVRRRHQARLGTTKRAAEGESESESTEARARRLLLASTTVLTRRSRLRLQRLVEERLANEH